MQQRTPRAVQPVDRMSRLRIALIILVAACAQANAADGGDSPKAAETKEIPYSSLDDAMKALRAKPGVKFRNEDGWIIADDSEAIVAWLLTPRGHPAYPSIVKRHVVNTADGAYMATDIRCFATKAACDSYFGSK
jgi:hypothetical protein